MAKRSTEDMEPDKAKKPRLGHFVHYENQQERFEQMLFVMVTRKFNGKYDQEDKEALKSVAIAAFPFMFHVEYPEKGVNLLFTDKKLFDKMIVSVLFTAEGLGSRNVALLTDADEIGRIFDTVDIEQIACINNRLKMLELIVSVDGAKIVLDEDLFGEISHVERKNLTKLQSYFLKQAKEAFEKRK